MRMNQAVVTKRIICTVVFISVLIWMFGMTSCNKLSIQKSETLPGGGAMVSRAKGYTNMADMATDSPIIVIGKVSRVLSAVQESEFLYITNFVFQTTTVFKGDVKGEIIVTQCGTPDAPWAVVNDDPLLQTGEKYLLFLNINSRGTYFYYGPSARYKIQNNKVYSMNYILQNDAVYKVPEALDFNGVKLTTVNTMITETLDTVRFISPSYTKLLSGETGKIDVVLASGKSGESNGSYKINRLDSKTGGKQIAIPEGMDISIAPSEFVVSPYSDYKSVITIKTDEQIITPGDYWILVEYDIGGVVSGRHIITVNIDIKKLSEIETQPQ